MGAVGGGCGHLIPQGSKSKPQSTESRAQRKNSDPERNHTAAVLTRPWNFLLLVKKEELLVQTGGQETFNSSSPFFMNKVLLEYLSIVLSIQGQIVKMRCHMASKPTTFPSSFSIGYE